MYTGGKKRTMCMWEGAEVELKDAKEFTRTVVGWMPFLSEGAGAGRGWDRWGGIGVGVRWPNHGQGGG